MKKLLSLLTVSVLLYCLALPAAAASAKPVDTSGFAAEMLRLVNAERAKAGLKALGSLSALDAAAQKRADEITRKMSHTRPGGRDCFTVLNDYGVEASHRGENVAAGYASPKEAVTAWMKSSGHKKNILGDFSKLGVGVAVKGSTVYWVQLFIREGPSAKPAPAWKSWPLLMQLFARFFLFGWIWMD